MDRPTHGVGTASAVITGTDGGWNAPTNLPASAAQAQNPQVGLSADGSQATAVVKMVSGGVAAASANIVGNVATWDADFTSIDGTDAGESPSIGVSADGSLITAAWDGGSKIGSASAVRTYTVTFNANGGGGGGTMPPQSANAATALAANSFTRTGYP